MDKDKIKEISKLICSLCPEQVADRVYSTFGFYSKNELISIITGFEVVSKNVVAENPELSAAAINGFILGVMIAESYENEEVRRIMFTKYFDHMKIQKGENVFDFNEFKRNKMI